jgi:uncharacterized protein YacL (UPF0231 family)
MYIALCLGLVIFWCLFVLIFKQFGHKMQKWLDAKIKEGSNTSNNRQKLLEEEYKNYSTDELLVLLQNIRTKRESHKPAIFGVAITRMHDERIKKQVQQLTNSIDYVTRTNANVVMRYYYEQQYADCGTNDLLDVLQDMEERNKQEITVILAIAATKMNDQRVRLCIEQLQKSKNRFVRKQAKQMMKDYMA